MIALVLYLRIRCRPKNNISDIRNGVLILGITSELFPIRIAAEHLPLCITINQVIEYEHVSEIRHFRSYYGFTEENGLSFVSNTLEFPIGLELPIVENGFVIYMGAQHTVGLGSFNATVKRIRRDNRVVTRIYDDGTVSTQIDDINNEPGAEEEFTVFVDH